MMNADQLAQMNADELRALTVHPIAEIGDVRRDNTWKQLKVDQLTHEMALMKRRKFSASSAQLKIDQRHLFEGRVEADLKAMALEFKALQRVKTTAAPKETPKRAPVPANLPRTDVHHEPETTVCACGYTLTRIAYDVSEKIDYTPGVLTVERHVRGKLVCRDFETLVQAPVPPHVIDKGVPTSGLLAHVLVAKYLDHLPQYRTEGIFGRAGFEIPRSTLAQWVGRFGAALQPMVDALRDAMFGRGVLHANETPVLMLAPGTGKTHKAYEWA